MSSIKNIKYKDDCLDKTIKQILNIHDSNITFSKDAVSKENVHNRMATVFTYHARKNISRVVMDMNAGYDSVTKFVFPNARISIDRSMLSNNSIVRLTNNG
ncbi:transposase [Enterococcus avium]